MESFKKRQSLKVLVYAGLILILVKCASQIPPGGGDADKIPPVIEYVYPSNGTTNFNDDYFEITFSEYVDKRTAREAIFISPRLEKGIELDWSGTTLTVYFKEPLKENTTYNVSIGTDVKDINNNNNMAESFNFAFSTGDRIDKGIVEGKVYDEKPEGILIFAYKKFNEKFPDPATDQPDNITQVGKNGKYKIVGLSQGDYRIFAFRDDFKDFVYNVEDDEYGSPSKEITLTEIDSVISNVNFLMNSEDTTKANILNLTMTDAYHILVEISEFIDSTKLSALNFYIIDSTSNKKTDIKYFYKGEAKPKQYFVVVEDSLIIENDNYLFVENLFDNFQNVLLKEGTKFTASDRPDTTAPKLIKKITEYENFQTDFENAYVEFVFNDGFNFDEAKNYIQLYDLKGNLFPTEIIKNDDASFTVKSKAKLLDKSEYQIKIDLSKIKDAAGNSVDSVFTQKFSTINSLQFSGASGKVYTNHNPDNVYIELKNIDSKKKNYKKKINSNGEFKFERVVPGQYLIWSFFDADSNGEYSYGKINPFEKSEEFVFYPDTLNLKARWPVGDVFINY